MNRTTELIERIKGLPDDEWLFVARKEQHLDFGTKELQALAESHERMREALELYEGMMEDAAVIEFWGNREIYQHSSIEGRWFIERGSDEEHPQFNSPLEAYKALKESAGKRGE